jgi:mono/diheme cytochrome c family protein
MKSMHKIFITASAMLVIPLAAFSQTTANASHGKNLFISNGCAECHGSGAEGGTGPHLAPNPPSAAFIGTYIRHPAGEMPPYAASVVSDSDIADIYAYLQSIPAPPKLKDIPELNP